MTALSTRRPPNHGASGSESRRRQLPSLPGGTLTAAVLTAALLASSCQPATESEATPPADGRLSAFGEYDGYSDELYDSWVNTSQYVEMRDGVRLAVDVTLPAVGGVQAEGPFPVVWTHSRYHRNPGALAKVFAAEGAEVPEINSYVDANPALQMLVKHGYVVASVQVRGGGASFGTYEGLFSEAETDDAREMLEWFATQPWSDGNLGMWGGSYLGMTQYMAASEMHPALKAIVPNVAGLDMYDVLYPGGVYRKDMIDHWGGLTRNLDMVWTAPPVDADSDGSLLQAAIAEHEDNWDVEVEYGNGKFRDHDAPTLDWREHALAGVLEEVQEAAVPAYHLNGWFDIFVLDATLIYANYEGPQKLLIGAWSHAGMPDSALMAEQGRLAAIEHLRWFDHWLKGIDNGIMDEDPIQYALMVDPGEWQWQSAEAWPPQGTSQTSWHFASGPTGSVASANDGLLTTEGPAAESMADSYSVDLTATTGTTTRWDNAVGGAPVMAYPDLTSNDAKGLTYTSAPLTEDLTIVGHPVVHLWVTSSTRDGDFLVYLEEVDDEGRSHYLTEGVLRASHRKLSEAPWDNLGLPFHRSYREDVELLPDGEPTELTLDLAPTAAVFNAGHRIRVTILGADADNIELPGSTPTYGLHHGGAYPSRIVLPTMN